MRKYSATHKVTAVFFALFCLPLWGMWQPANSQSDGAPSRSAFVLVDDFEQMSTGVLNGQGGWVAAPEIVVDSDPVDPTNKVLRVEGGDLAAYKALPLEIPDGERGTLAFRLLRGGGMDGYIGLSDVESPEEFSAFETQLGVSTEQSERLRIRTGNRFADSDSHLYNSSWTCVWLAFDNRVDTFETYVQGGQFDQITRLSSDSEYTFSFRNGGRNALRTLFVRTGDSFPQPFYVDDLFISSGETDLSTPGHACGAVSVDERIEDPIPARIYHDGAAVQVEEVVKAPKTASQGGDPRTRLNFLYHARDGSDRIFLNDLRGQLYVIEPDIDNPETKNLSLYLNIKPAFGEWLEEPGLNSGFSTFAIHPQFAENGLFYTIHTENPNGTPDYTSFNPAPAMVHTVLVEWHADAPNAATFAGSHREVLRVEQSSAIHGMQLCQFNPNARPGDTDFGQLYISLGDGESASIFTDAAQNLRSLQGTIIRIDPRGSNSQSGRYGIPSDNPFVTNADNTILREIFAYGFRNPNRFTWDQGGEGHMVMAEIGEKQLDEINIILPGKNYGWNQREGTFRFDIADPKVVHPLPIDDAELGFTYPIAQYDHDEGFAIAGGYIYRGKLMPEMQGMYIFGDIVTGALFYIDMAQVKPKGTTQIHRLALMDESGEFIDLRSTVDPENQRADLRFGIDEENELYLFSKRDGVVRRLVSARPRPTGEWIKQLLKTSTGKAYLYAIAAAQIGAMAYTDAEWRLDDLPASLIGAEMLTVPNSEANVGASPHIVFELSKSAMIYIAIDNRGQLPVWMESWEYSGQSLSIRKGQSMVQLALYMRSFNAGTVTLGGADSERTRAEQNYILFAQSEPTPTSTPAPTVTIVATAATTATPNTTASVTPTSISATATLVPSTPTQSATKTPPASATDTPVATEVPATPNPSLETNKLQIYLPLTY